MDSRHITVTHACMISLFLSYGSPFQLPVLLFHVIGYMLYACFPLLILLIPLLDTCSRYWYGCSRYWTWEPLICDMWGSHIYCSRFPVYCSCYLDHVILFLIPVILFYAINRALVQLSCYPYHVLYWFLLHCILDISYHKENLGMGETWRLTRSYRVDVWIHCLSHCRGRGSAGYRLLLMSIPLLF